MREREPGTPGSLIDADRSRAPPARRAVERLVDREGTAAEADAARAHLQICPKCRAAARLLVQMKVALRRRAQREPDPLAVTRLRRYAVAVTEEGLGTN